MAPCTSRLAFGPRVRLVFWIEPRDLLYNGFRGWIVDDVRVTSELTVGTGDVVSGLQLVVSDEGRVVGHACGASVCLDSA